ncbi:MAG TPA: M20 family metallopeptidase [Methylomirabilota bacterium]
MATTVQASLLHEARGLLDDVIALRRRIHRHPEIGLTLPRTQQAVLEALDGLGLAIRTGQKTTSVVATLEGGRPGRTMLLRADMDALPLKEDTGLPFASEVDGAMHACGHDAHVAMLAGAARMLAVRRATLAGRVVFMFQPGEEGYHGARVMIEEGLLDGERKPDAAFGLHAGARLPAGVIGTRAGALLASGDTFQILVRGDGGHASAPHDCLDPIPIACEIVQAFQTLVTRRVNAFDPAVVTVAKIEAGTTRNIIPETASLLGTIRTVSEKTRTSVLDGVTRVAEGVAAAHGARAEVTLIRGYPVTVNDDGFAARVVRVATGLLGPERVQTMATPIMGSEDFSYVLQRVTGAFAFLGTRPAEGPAPPNHSNRMLVNEDALPAGVAMHVAVALDFLNGH